MQRTPFALFVPDHPNVSCVLFDDHLSLPDALPIPVSAGRHAYSTPIMLLPQPRQKNIAILLIIKGIAIVFV